MTTKKKYHYTGHLSDDIKKSYLSLLCKHEKVTTTMALNKLDVTTPAMYNYFKTRDNLQYQVAKDVLNKICETLACSKPLNLTLGEARAMLDKMIVLEELIDIDDSINTIGLITKHILSICRGEANK